MQKFKGIFPALVTPYAADNTIHAESLRQIVQLNMAQGVSGFYVGGSTAEVLLLTLEERKEILEIVAAEVGGRCTILAHIGCISTEQAIELAKHAAGVGVDAISSVPPFYYPFSLAEIQNYYREIMDQVEIPMILYNFPIASGVTFTSENSKELLADSRVLGVKHTSFDLYQLERMKEENSGLILFSGYDQVYLAGLAMGADGAIGSTFNIMADRFLEIERLYNAGAHQEARQAQSRVNEPIKRMKQVGIMQSIKYVLEQKGIECGRCRSPFKSLDDSEKAFLRTALHGVLF